MSPYAPTSRRQIAELFRKTAYAPAALLARRGVHPDVVSYPSLAAAAAAAACFWWARELPILLLVGPAFCHLRLWLNMLDGMVALSSGKASARGEIVNELPDRISDLIIFAGVAHSGLCHPLTGYWAAIAALLVAYVGVLGAATGAGRQFGGSMAKPWRMIVLHAGAWTALGFLWWGGGEPALGGLSVLDWTYLAIVAGGVQTVWVRLARILRGLEARQGSSSRSPQG
jgi:phosphatidylglycerophosphate synthase